MALARNIAPQEGTFSRLYRLHPWGPVSLPTSSAQLRTVSDSLWGSSAGWRGCCWETQDTLLESAPRLDHPRWASRTCWPADRASGLGTVARIVPLIGSRSAKQLFIFCQEFARGVSCGALCKSEIGSIPRASVCQKTLLTGTSEIQKGSALWMPGCCHQRCVHVSSRAPRPPPSPILGVAGGDAAVFLVSNVAGQKWARLYFIDLHAASGLQRKH